MREEDFVQQPTVGRSGRRAVLAEPDQVGEPLQGQLAVLETD